MNSQFAINIVSLGKRFKDTYIFKDLNLQVKSGEVFGFLGRNGAGKSTLINTFTGINNKTDGSFELLNISDEQVNDIKAHIGVMPDTSNLYQHMSALKFMKFMSDLKKLRYTNRGLMELLELVGLENTGRRKIKNFSFGMKKKISIAQALLGSPKLLILDEPTSGLDPESSIHIQNIIRQLKKDGSTIFITSHNMEEIEKICDRIAIMQSGKINCIGTVQELKQQFSAEIKIKIESHPRIKKTDIENFNIQNINMNEEVVGNQVVINLSNYEEIPILLNCLIKNHFKIYNFEQERVTLEEIFLSV